MVVILSLADGQANGPARLTAIFLSKLNDENMENG